MGYKLLCMGIDIQGCLGYYIHMPANHNIPHTEKSKAKMSASHKGIPLLNKRRLSRTENGVEIFRCSSCHNFYPREGFYKNKRTILGLTSECKKCHILTSIKTRNRENGKRLNRESARRNRAKNPEKFRERELNYSHKREKNEKTKARELLNAAIRSGKIIKPDRCHRCGTIGRVTAHHQNYKQPLEVEWLCYECHGNK